MRNDIRIGFTFNGKHSYRDYGMYLSEPPDFGVPEPKLSVIEIPGRDGYLDYTEAAAGEVKYSNRQMRFVFVTEIRRERREALRSDLWVDLQGQIAEIVYDLDPNWCYTGRCSVSFEDVLDWKMKIVVSVDANPYKLARDYTIVTADPSTFAAETIFLGQGNAAQGRNTIFTFGTKDAPQLDLTAFSTLTILWEDEAPYGEPLLQIADGAGNVYNDHTWINALIDGRPATVIDVDDITGINKSLVYRILCQNRSMGRLEGLTTASATVTAYVERMTVVPVWSSTADVTAFINGRKFEIPEGSSYNYEIQLKQGENQISFIADSADETIQLQYRDGRL